RMAVATAKMLCEALGASCIAVPTALVVARRVESPPARFGVALASKGELTFMTVFESGQAGPGRLVDAAGMRDLGLELLIADRFLPGPIVEEAARLGVEVRPPRLDPAACFEVS